MRTQTIITYALAATIILILGAFSGWYFFLKTQSREVLQEATARGYRAPQGGSGVTGVSALKGTAPQTDFAPKSEAGIFSRLLNSIIGGEGTGVTDPASLDGFTAGISEGPTDEETTLSVTTGESPVPAIKRPPQFSQIHNKPVAGLSFVQTRKGERLQYVERSSGYVFETDPETATTLRVTNTLLPKIQEAFFTNGRIVQRSLNDSGDIVTIVGSISTSTGEGSTATESATLSNVSLAQNIMHITSNPKTGALFYLVREGLGTVGILSKWNGDEPKRIFTSVLPNWRSQWLSDGRIILTQAASDDTPGYAYEMTSSGVLSPLIRSIPGLTVLGREGGAFLYGQSSGGALTLFAHTQASSTMIRLPVRTIADKCVWLPGRSSVAYCGVPQGITARYFLDDWYRGATHSSDVLWRVDTNAGTAEILYAPEPGTSIDMENLTISRAGTHLAFMNAADKSLWLLRIEE